MSLGSVAVVLTALLLSPAAGQPLSAAIAPAQGEVAAPSVATMAMAPGDAAARIVATGLIGVGGPAALDPDVTAMLADCDDDFEVLEGQDRFATAAAVADRGWQGGPVYLASGRNFPDALAATPVVASAKGALLLTESGTLPTSTRAWLEAHDVPEVVVLGGTTAISDRVMTAVGDIVDDVRRVQGTDRFATAAAVADELPDADVVYVAAGRSFADALSVGPVAATNDGVIALVEADRVPAATASLLRDRSPSSVVVVGGTAVILDSVVAELERLSGATVTRIAGVDRYATSAALAEEMSAGTGAVVVSGRGFPDALAAGPMAAAGDLPLLLVGDDVAPEIGDILDARRAWACRTVRLETSPTEGLTLGPSSIGGTTLVVSTPQGHSVPIRRADRAAGILLEGAATIGFTYPAPAGGVAAVTWEQLVDPTQPRVVAEQPWRGQLASPPQGITAAWQYTGDSARYRQEVAAAPGLSITAPFRYFLTDSGGLSGGADAAFIADMHAQGVEVWPTVHTGGAEAMVAALTDPDRRADYALRISRDAEAAGADGVNIDIEGFQESLSAAVTDFTELLSQDVHRWGGVTSFDVTSMTDTWITPPVGYEFWSTAPDRRAIANAVDYTVLMAYDQFNRFRPRGPVAADWWVEEALCYQLRFSDPDRILLGLPLYARVWRGENPSAVGQSALKSLIAGGTRRPDPAFGVDQVRTADGRVTWAETSDRLTTRLALVEQYGLAGTASWRLGFDDAATWNTLGK